MLYTQVHKKPIMHDHKNTLVSKVLDLTSNRLDLAVKLTEHWTSIPKVAGSIPTVVRQTFQPAWCGCTLRGRLHGRVVPAKRVDSLCRVDPLPICIVHYFDISITCKASCPALPGPRL